MKKHFEEVRGKLGFGCMRLPMKGDEVDYAAFTKMIDAFLAAGFNYFDTARVYIQGKSEIAMRECLCKRYPRESFLFADKLSESCFGTEEDVRPFFESQLESTGAGYFDFYLMHAQNRNNYPKYQQARAYEIAGELKKEGKIRHVGLSFHDTADILDRILTDHPEVEFVQLQFNYLDQNDPGVQSKACYDVAVKHGKPVVVMEPVRGGLLADLSDEAKAALSAIDEVSPAAAAIRYAASYEQIFMVLSGMSNEEQMQDNVSAMRDFSPYSEEQIASFSAICDILHSRPAIPCTACRYCVDGCPKKILIPDLFDCYNQKIQYRGRPWGAYHHKFTVDHGKASECIRCGKCEKSCPQRLPIRDLLTRVAEEFE